VPRKSPLQKAASILGSVKSEKKAAAARANGAKTKKTLAARKAIERRLKDETGRIGLDIYLDAKRNAAAREEDMKLLAARRRKK